jgi:GNAT superfamily N-acetyltransferase
VSTWPEPGASLRLEPVAAADFEAMAALRIRAMRPSLEALGRFDPTRARERLAAAFAPAFMHHLVRGGERLGFMTLRPLPDGSALGLEHLYVDPAHQGQGVGAWALDVAKSRADLARLPLVVEALKGSAANRFYRRHGFAEVGQGEWELHHRREPQADPLAVVKAMWDRFEARDWAAARTLLHDELVVRWWASGERFVGADCFIAIQIGFPEGWHIHPMSFDTLDDGRVRAFVRVEHPPHGVYLVQQTVRVRDGRIAEGDELWATCEPPEPWRTPERFAGLERLA